MNIYTSTLVFLLLISFSATAQQEFRELYTNDSTTYVLNSDTSIVVSKTKLYYLTDAGLTMFQDFSVADTTMYITDFDIVSQKLWYLIFGQRFGGNFTTLYKSKDSGVSWHLDTSIYDATQVALDAGQIADEILYQLQPISEDTILMFVSYYQFGIFYSINSGQSWNLWFANAIAHYKGLFECEDQYYLWGLEGDGFPGMMFGFDSELLLSPDTNDVWKHWTGSYVYHPDCYNAVNPDCIFAPRSLSGYNQFLIFEDYINQNCPDSISSIISTPELKNIQIYPNPSDQGRFRIEWGSESAPPLDIKIYTASGQLLSSTKILFNNFHE